MTPGQFPNQDAEVMLGPTPVAEWREAISDPVHRSRSVFRVCTFHFISEARAGFRCRRNLQALDRDHTTRNNLPERKKDNAASLQTVTVRFSAVQSPLGKATPSHPPAQVYALRVQKGNIFSANSP